MIFNPIYGVEILKGVLSIAHDSTEGI